jgi:hypothetical protein
VNGCGLSAISSAGDMAQPSHGDIDRCVWESVAIALAKAMAESRHYDIDSKAVRAHVSGAGEQGIHQRALGRTPSGFTTKIHCLSEAGGRPGRSPSTSPPGEAAGSKSLPKADDHQPVTYLAACDKRNFY